MSQAPSEPVYLRGHKAHVLDDDRAEWLVESGKANVFCVRLENGQPVGPRKYLMTGQAGEAVLGSVSGISPAGVPLANGYRFLAVGSEDCCLRQLSPQELAQGMEDPASLAARQLSSWVDKLTNLLATDLPMEAPVSVGATSRPLLTAGQVFRSAPRTVSWLRVEQGALVFMGLADLRVDASTAVFPIASEAWFRAEEDTQLVLVPAAEIVDPATVTRGLSQLHALMFAYLRRQESIEARQDVERLRQRQRIEAEETSRAINQLVNVVQLHEDPPAVHSDMLQALAVVGKCLQVRFAPAAGSEDLSRLPDPLEAIARASHLRLRHVRLRGRWWDSDCGPLLGYLSEGEAEFPVALVRTARGRYEIFDPRVGVQRTFDPALYPNLSPRAVMFYRGFPEGPVKLLDLPRHALTLYRREIVFLLALCLVMTGLGMLLPQATRWIIDHALPEADRGLLWDLGLILFGSTCGQAALMLAQGYLMLRLQTGATVQLQAATWDRLLRLPTQFFRQFSSGDLLNRSMMITEVSHAISGAALRSLVTGALTLFYLALLFHYSVKLAFFALLVALVVAAVTVVLSLSIRRRALDMEVLDGKVFGFIVQVINGIAKLRVAGAERRAYSKWAMRFAQQLRLTAQVKSLQIIGDLFNFMVAPLSTLVIFLLVVGMLSGSKDSFTMGTFLAFFTAFGTFVGGMTSVSHTLVDIMDSLAKQKLMKPLLEALPESDSNRADPGRLTGNIHVHKLVFRYQPTGPLILNGVQITAHAGEFVALVGPSGSGKSTLLRLLLGFETPESGSISFDGKNLGGLDLTAVRRQFGAVLQSARINAGSIFDNIASGNVISMEECWQAIRDAGMEEDVQGMPMGIHTVVSEGGGNLSGGQRQRLLIARALVLNPKILLFDEATSALDNTTQAIVTRSLKRRRVTRIVIAHRLSTIQDADRIYVLERGQVTQAGSFADLSAQDGLFRRLMARQMT